MKENSEKIGTTLKKKIYHSNISDKWAKINSGGKEIRKKKEKKRKRDFEGIEGEKIIRVRNENQTKRKMKLKMKKGKGRRMAKWSGRWQQWNWIFEYKNSEHLGIKFKKCNHNHHINNQWAKH